jgi:hypothetical protein
MRAMGARTFSSLVYTCVYAHPPTRTHAVWLESVVGESVVGESVVGESVIS